MSSVPLSLAAIGNLADNQNNQRELEDFLEVAEARVPEVRKPVKRSPLELILQAVQPVVGAFAQSRLARPQDRRRAFIGGLAQGFGRLGLEEAARPRLEEERIQREEDVRGLNVLRAALQGQRTAVAARPRSLQEVEAGRVASGKSTTEEAAARLRAPSPTGIRFSDSGQPFTVSPQGEFAPATQVFQRPQLGVPPVIGPLIRSDQTFGVREPTEFRDPAATQRFTLGAGQGRFEQRPGEEPELVARGAPVTRRPTQAQLRRGREQAARGNIVNNVGAIAEQLFPGVSPGDFLPEQEIAVLDALEKQLRDSETPENTLDVQLQIKFIEDRKKQRKKQAEEKTSLDAIQRQIGTSLSNLRRRGVQ